MHRRNYKESSVPANERKPAFSWVRGVLFAFLGIGLCALAFGTVVLVAFYTQMDRSLPSVQSLKDYHPPIVSSMYAADGSLIGEFYAERRVLLPLADMPTQLIQAFLAAEDSRFFEHPGLDFVGIMRAMLKNMRAGEIVQGGSTITQQVAKSLLLTPERTWTRKLKEAILAYRIDHYLTKDETLYIYLNQIYLGEGAYGVEAAAQTYFGKHVHELDLAECALLAGLPQAPSRYSPIRHFDHARERQHYVLQQMASLDHITTKEAGDAFQEKLQFATPKRWGLKDMNYFTEQVRRDIEARYGHDALYKQGLQIYTTLDPNAQAMAEKALDRGLRELDKRHGYRGAHQSIPQKKWREFTQGLVTNNKELAQNRVVEALVTGFDQKGKFYQLDLGAAKGQLPASATNWAASRRTGGLFQPGDAILVKLERHLEKQQPPTWVVSLEQEPEVQGALMAMNHHTGAVVCMVGGRDFEESQFNRAVQAIRQPGSSFKPIVYAAALDHGFSPASVLMDTPISFGDHSLQGRWTPANYDNRFWGPILLRNALIHSRNVVTVKLLQAIGVNTVRDYAKRLGINSPLTPNLSLALGASGLTLWEMLTAYSTFADQGERSDPYMVERVLDRHGQPLEQHQLRQEAVISPQTAYLMTHIMQGVIEEGTGRRARKLGRPAAGKTGTSNDLKDAWFMGYTPSILAGVWMGYDDVDLTLGNGETGGHAACPVWLYFMEDYLKDTPIEVFPVPSDIVFAKVSAQGGGRSEDQPEGGGRMVTEAFRKDQLPSVNSFKEQDESSEPDASEESDTHVSSSTKSADPTASFFKSDLY
jgi:penicillin-binding protein 1A